MAMGLTTLPRRFTTCQEGGVIVEQDGVRILKSGRQDTRRIRIYSERDPATSTLGQGSGGRTS